MKKALLVLLILALVATPALARGRYRRATPDVENDRWVGEVGADVNLYQITGSIALKTSIDKNVVRTSFDEGWTGRVYIDISNPIFGSKNK